MIKEFPLVVPPKQNRDADIIHVKASRSNVEFFQRKAVANVMEQLSPTLQDAAIEICLAPQVYENPGKYRMMNYGRVSGMSPAEVTAYMLDVKKRYEDWRKRMASDKPLKVSMSNGKPMFVPAQKALSVCVLVCQEEKSVDAITKSSNMSHTTVIRLLQAGLSEYSIISGWEI